MCGSTLQISINCGLLLMAWFDYRADIPLDNENFQKIILNLLFLCPVCIKKKVKKDTASNRKITTYKPVSVQKCDFRSKGIVSNALTTILAQMRRPLKKFGAYASLKSGENVEEKVKDIIKTSSAKDIHFEFIVYSLRDDMSDAETIFYYIRNSFAHGSFEYVPEHKCYLLESAKDGKIKAQMRLKEATLLKYCDLARINLANLKDLQYGKSRKKR